MTERLWAHELAILRDEINEYLESGTESDLEWIETKMALALCVQESSHALLVWNFVNRYPRKFGMDPATMISGMQVSLQRAAADNCDDDD